MSYIATVRSGSCSVFSLLCVLATSLLLTACQADKGYSIQDPGPLYPPPTIVPLNLEDGYSVNPVTGDSIQFEENTIVTGKLIPFAGKEPDPADILPPFAFKAQEPRVTEAESNTHRLVSPPDKVIINRDSVIIKTIQDVLAVEEHTQDPSSNFIEVTAMESPGPRSSGFFMRPIPASLPSYRDNFTRNISWLDVREALEAPIVNRIAQDQLGNIWFGSGFGACMYDGVNYYKFSGEEYRYPVEVSCLYLDKDSALWMGASDGIYSYDGDSMYYYSLETGLAWDQGRVIFQDSRGVLWFGFETGGLSSFNGSKFTHYHLDEGVNDFGIRGITEDSDGNIWIATWGKGLIRFDGSTFRYHMTGSGLLADYLMFLNRDSKGNLWFSSDDVLHKLSGDTLYSFTTEQGMRNHYVSHCAFDEEDHLWYATNGGGVTMFDGKSFHDYTIAEGMTVDYIFGLCIDSDQNIWAGTTGGGVCIINKNRLAHFDEGSGLSHNVVFSILEDSDQNLWFGTRGGGVNRYDGTRFEHYTRELLNLGNNYVLSIMQDRLGQMWFGTYGNGVSLFSGDSIYVANIYHGFSDYTVNCMEHDLHGDYWFGTYRGGLTRFNGTTFTHYNWNNTGIGNRISALLEDSRGNLWIAAYPGVLRVRNDSVLVLSTREGLLDPWVYALTEDHHGNIWFGTSNGVSVYTGDHFINFMQENGLCHRTIKTIQEAQNGDLWMSTPNGLTRMVFEGDKRIFNSQDSSCNFPKLISYGIKDGLKGTNFFHNSAIDSKNRIWFGTGTNLTMLDLDQFDYQKDPPRLRLNSIDLNGEPVDFRDTRLNENNELNFDGVVRYHNIPTNLVLAHSRKHVTFHFSALDWSAPAKIRYSYMMKGMDAKWSSPGNQNQVDYRNLPAGRHTFMVRAIGESQQWSEVLSYDFTVRPPWYLSRAMIFLYFLLGFLIFLAVLGWRTAHLKAKQKKLEAIIHQATQEIREQKEEVESQRDEIEAQRDEIEAQRDSLQEQRDIVMGQKKEITDSINYAERIQHAILPEDALMDEVLPQHFVIFHPRDIVSGDFYWVKLIRNFLALVVADCTGHGVPGAIMSMLGISLLNEQVSKSRLDKPGEVLDRLRRKVKVTLSQEGKMDEQKDGMDMSMVILDRENLSLQFSGAYHSLLIVRPKSASMEGISSANFSLSTKDYQLIEYKGDRQPIGIYEMEKEFTSHEVQLLEGDTLYLHTDGFTDQIGGPGNKKFMTRNLKRTLLQIQELSMAEQKDQLELILSEWMGKHDQVDDILLIGIRVFKCNPK